MVKNIYNISIPKKITLESNNMKPIRLNDYYKQQLFRFLGGGGIDILAG